MAPTRSSVRKYTIELAPSKDALVRKVNERLETGWELQGPLSIKYPKNALLPIYGQALIWRKESDPSTISSSSSGCLGVALLCAFIPPVATIAGYLF